MRERPCRRSDGGQLTRHLGDHAVSLVPNQPNHRGKEQRERDAAQKREPFERRRYAGCAQHDSVTSICRTPPVTLQSRNSSRNVLRMRQERRLGAENSAHLGSLSTSSRQVACLLERDEDAISRAESRAEGRCDLDEECERR